MAVYWVTEVIPLAVTALLPMVLFPTLGVLDSKRTCSNYLKDTNMLFVGGLIVATAVEKWNLHRRIALRVLLLVGSKPAWLMFGFMSTTAFLSMWMSNTATTAMMVPIAHAVIVELLEKKRQFAKGITLCIAYAANIGGTATLTGTGPNLVISGQVERQVIWFGQSDLSVSHCIDTFSKQNVHSPVRLYGPDAVIDFGSWFMYAFPGMLVCLFLAWLWLGVVYLNLRKILRGWFSQCVHGQIGQCCRQACSCNCCCCKKRTEGKADDPVTAVIQKQYDELGPMTWAEKAVLGHFILLAFLWLSRDPKFAPGWVSAFIPGALNQFNQVRLFVCYRFYCRRVCLILLFCFPARPPNFGCLRMRQDDSVAGPKQALLDWHTVNTKLPWNVVILLGGGFALAEACKESGLSEWLGSQFVVLAVIPPAAMVLIITVIIAMFTEITSNTSTASIFLPILGQLGTSIGVHPFYFMVPATVACSFAFMLPVATPPNAIVFAYGTLSIVDMASTGAMMNFLCILVVNLGINTIGWWQFDLGTFPDWAAAPNTTMSATAAPINCSEYFAAYLDSSSNETLGYDILLS
uniref:Solute carrier family 13 member 5-like n=1 Tax=Saccoglossus kowalevskii TaxID=10224 RepID=A0ABM0M3X0_SACKO|nr:PREDICTED: solute carrier family 13 member 5-like [Saccoglossus kowalevskii]